MPQGPPVKKRSPLPFILGGAFGFLVLVAAGAFGFFFLKGRSKAVALPIEAKLLPSNTSEISTQVIESTRETDPRVKRVYLAAELGTEMCKPGSSNPARRIEGMGSGSSKSAKEFFFDAKNLDDVRSVLDCGSVLEESLESPFRAVITLEDPDGKRSQRIGVGHFKVAELPKKNGYTAFSFKGLPGYCRTIGDDRGTFGAPAPAAGVCDDSSFGAFAQGTTWFLGNKTALETMASSVKNPKEDLNARLEAIKDAAAETEGLAVTRLTAQPKSSREFFVAPCLFGASNSSAGFTAFIDGCFPGKGVEKLLEQVDSKLKAAAFETDGDPAKAGALQGNVIFVARDDSAAKAVEVDVNEIVSEWKSHLEQNEAKLTIQSNEATASARQKKFAGLVDNYIKALRGSKVTRKGRTIRIAYKEVLSKADLVAMEEADKVSADKKVATAEILEAIKAKKAIPQPALAKLVGPAWATFLAAPAPVEQPPSAKVAMSVVDCKKLQSRLAPFSVASFPTTNARVMFLGHKFAKCGVRSPELDDVQRACIAAFKTPAEYAQCASPDVGATVPHGQPAEEEFGERKKK